MRRRVKIRSAAPRGRARGAAAGSGRRARGLPAAPRSLQVAMAASETQKWYMASKKRAILASVPPSKKSSMMRQIDLGSNDVLLGNGARASENSSHL